MVGLFPWQEEKMGFETGVFHSPRLYSTWIKPLFFVPTSASQIWLLWWQVAEPLFLLSYSSISNFLRNSILFSTVAIPILHSHQQCTRVPFSPHPHQHLLVDLSMVLLGFFNQFWVWILAPLFTSCMALGKLLNLCVPLLIWEGDTIYASWCQGQGLNWSALCKVQCLTYMVCTQ